MKYQKSKQIKNLKRYINCILVARQYGFKRRIKDILLRREIIRLDELS